MSRSRSRSPSPKASNANGADSGGAPSGAPSDGDGNVKLYVGNISFDSDERRLKDSFSSCGEVIEVFIPIGRDTGRPRGFAFVTMKDKAASDAAIAKLDNTDLDGRTIRVNESRPKGAPPPGQAFNAAGAAEVKLYVGNLSFESTVESVQALFEQYGTVSDCFLPSDRETGRTRGFAFVTMPSNEAEVACSKCHGCELDGRAIRVNEAQPKRERRDFGGDGGGGWGGPGGGGYDNYRGGGGGYGGGGKCIVHILR